MNKYAPTFVDLAEKGPFELNQLLDRDGQLSISLSDENDVEHTLIFDDFMLYRKIDEGDALRTLASISDSGLRANWFYIVKDSEFVAWYNYERCRPDSLQELFHFVIATSNDIIDVISLSHPVFSARS